jgi:hypothetical protein
MNLFEKISSLLIMKLIYTGMDQGEIDFYMRLWVVHQPLF